MSRGKRRVRRRAQVRRTGRKPWEWPTVDGTVLTPVLPASVLRAREIERSYKARP